MQTTQLDPKVERYLAEVQKILDRNPATRRKLWLSVLITIITVTFLIIFFMRISEPLSAHPDKDGTSYIILGSTVVSWISLSFAGACLFSFFLMSLMFASGRVITIKVIKATHQLYQRLYIYYPNRVEVYFSDKAHKKYKNLRGYYYGLSVYFWFISVIMGFEFCLFIKTIMRMQDLLSMDLMYPTMMVAMIKWLSITTGFMCGIAFTMSMFISIDSAVKLFAVKSYWDELLLKLLGLEREIVAGQTDNGDNTAGQNGTDTTKSEN